MLGPAVQGSYLYCWANIYRLPDISRAGLERAATRADNILSCRLCSAPCRMICEVIFSSASSRQWGMLSIPFFYFLLRLNIKFDNFAVLSDSQKQQTTQEEMTRKRQQKEERCMYFSRLQSSCNPQASYYLPSFSTVLIASSRSSGISSEWSILRACCVSVTEE